MRVQPFEAFNVVKSESVVMLDCSHKTREPLCGTVSVDFVLPLSKALLQARQKHLDDFCPDDPSCVVIFDDSNSQNAEEASEVLEEIARCRRVLCVDKKDFVARYPFVLDTDSHFLESAGYPSEILEGRLFLGSALAIESQQRLDNLGITHVVSVIDRKIPVPIRQKHLWCQVEDEPSESLAPVMHKAMPFISSAIAAGGRILVHCEQGRSRSASVVVAHLMFTNSWDAEKSLRFVQQQRSSARPNDGFMLQLGQLNWQSHKQAAPETSSMHMTKRMESDFAGKLDCTEDGPSSIELTDWILTSFSVDSCVPEQDALSVADMGSWLQDEGGSKCTSAALENDLGTVLEGLLTRRESKRIISETERLGYGVTSFPQQYRGNRRLQVDDTTGALAAKVWDRIRTHVPSSITVDWTPEDSDYPTGIWKPVGCNTRFRFSKYFAGAGFQTHRDSMCCFGCDQFSLLTVNIYLNDLELSQHGRTRFFLERDGAAVDSAGGAAGSAVLFKQEHALHDGEVLNSGLKYLMRTDVIFEKVLE